LEAEFKTRRPGKAILVLEDDSHLADQCFGAVKKVQVRSYSELQWWGSLSAYVNGMVISNGDEMKKCLELSLSIKF
jgi:hypothetical protein